MKTKTDQETKFYPFTNQLTFSRGKAPRTKVLCFSHETCLASVFADACHSAG